MKQSTWASTRYAHEADRGDLLLEWVRAARADGVVFAAPSCDPALLDQPPLSKAMERAGVPYALLKCARRRPVPGGARRGRGDVFRLESDCGVRHVESSV